MALDWFVISAKEYMVRAGWSGADDEERMLTWVASLEKIAVTKDEFDEASQRLQESGFPLARANHLASLLSHVRFIRENAREREKAQQERSGGKCLTCGGSGLVLVPHPRYFNKDGSWSGRYTCGVICGCPAAEKWNKVQVMRDGYPVGPLTLERYEREVCGNWRDWLEWWTNEKEVRDRAKPRIKRDSVIERNPFKNALKQTAGAT
jgi:hypothetical protein